MIKYCTLLTAGCGYQTYGESNKGCCYPEYCDYQVPRDSRVMEFSQANNTKEQEKENNEGRRRSEMSKYLAILIGVFSVFF